MAVILKTALVTLDGSAQRIFSAPYPRVQSMYIRALSTNSAAVWIGDANVNPATQRGIKIAADTFAEITGDANHGGGVSLINTDEVYVKGTAADVICVVYLEKVS